MAYYSDDDGGSPTAPVFRITAIVCYRDDPNVTLARPKDHMIRETLYAHESVRLVIDGPPLRVVLNSNQRLLKGNFESVRSSSVAVAIPNVSFDIIVGRGPMNV